MKTIIANRSSDWIALVRQIGEDPATFFENGYWFGADFTKSDMRGVSWKGAIIDGAQFREGDLPDAERAKARSARNIIFVAAAPEASEAKVGQAVTSMNRTSSGHFIRKSRVGNVVRFSPGLDQSLFHYPQGKVSAVRLWGEELSSVTEDSLRIDYIDDHLDQVPNAKKAYHLYIERKKIEASRHRKEFFNGPNTRLISWRATPEDGPGAASEAPILQLRLGPVGWYEFSFLNDRERKHRTAGRYSQKYLRSIDVGELVNTGDVGGSKLSNILDTATTIITRDGFAAYMVRGRGVDAVPSRLTSSIAENINRWLDESEVGLNSQLVDPNRHIAILSNRNNCPDNSYKPTIGVPNPFATVRRGLDFEIADGLSSRLRGQGSLRLIGLSFDLEAGHPDALFLLAIDMTKETLEDYRVQNPGWERREGSLMFAPARFDDPMTSELLSDPRWVVGGKASFVRAIQFLNSLIGKTGSFERAYEIIMTGVDGKT